MDLASSISIVTGGVAAAAAALAVGGWIRQREITSRQVERLDVAISSKVNETSCTKQHAEIVMMLGGKASKELLEQRRIDHERRIDAADRHAQEARALVQTVVTGLATINGKLDAQTAAAASQAATIHERLTSIEASLREERT